MLGENFVKLKKNYSPIFIVVKPSKAVAILLDGNSKSLPSLLLEVLRAGSVPILVGGQRPASPNSLLPFAHLIDWEKALLWIPKTIFAQQQLEISLKSIDEEQWAQFRRNGRFLLEHYLGNAKGWDLFNPVSSSDGKG